MDVGTFAKRLLSAVSARGVFERVELRSEGPVAEGRAHVGEGLFLRFYFNEQTQTMAFALILGDDDKRRVWGIDRDNRRGWHEHPADRPTDHVSIEPPAIAEIVARLNSVLEEHFS